MTRAQAHYSPFFGLIAVAVIALFASFVLIMLFGAPVLGEGSVLSQEALREAERNTVTPQYQPLMTPQIAAGIVATVGGLLLVLRGDFE